jgi:hypothetical protein
MSNLLTVIDPGTLIPTTWDAATVFGGIAGVLGNSLFLGAMVIGVAFAYGPRLYRKVKSTVSR